MSEKKKWPRINPDSVDLDAIETRIETACGTRNPAFDLLDALGAARGYQRRIESTKEILRTFLADPDPSEAYEVLLRVEKAIGSDR